MRLPNLFIVGAAKGGTTSLWDYLDSHSAGVYGSDQGAQFLFTSGYGRGEIQQRVPIRRPN